MLAASVEPSTATAATVARPASDLRLLFFGADLRGAGAFSNFRISIPIFPILINDSTSCTAPLLRKWGEAWAYPLISQREFFNYGVAVGDGEAVGAGAACADGLSIVSTVVRNTCWPSIFTVVFAGSMKKVTSALFAVRTLPS